MSRTTFIMFAIYSVGGALIWGVFDQSFTVFLILCVCGIPLGIFRAYVDRP